MAKPSNQVCLSELICLVVYGRTHVLILRVRLTENWDGSLWSIKVDVHCSIVI